LLAKLDGSSTTQALPTKLETFFKKLLSSVVSSPPQEKKGTLNSPGKHLTPTANCKLGNAACIILGDCDCAKEGVTTPIAKNLER